MKKHILAFGACFLMLGAYVQAGEVDATVVEAQADEYAEIRELVTIIMPGSKADSVKPAAIEGLYEVTVGQDVLYMTKDARYIIQGMIFDWKRQVDLTNQARVVAREKMNPIRKAAIDSLDVNDMIVYAPEETKYTVTVVTDIDCFYCRKLHAEMDQYNEQGIAIRYIAYPRAGLNSPSYEKAVAAWCANDRNIAMNEAKRDPENAKRAKKSEDCDDPVADQWQLVRSFGVSGTPALILDDGQIISGYVPADRLAGILKSK